MKKGLEFWFPKVLSGEIRKSEMHFIIDLEEGFTIKQLSAKRVLSWLLNNKLKEIAVFTKSKMPYSLNISEIPNNSPKSIILTSNKYFEVDGEIETIFNFLNEKLNLITDFRTKDNEVEKDD